MSARKFKIGDYVIVRKTNLIGEIEDVSSDGYYSLRIDLGSITSLVVGAKLSPAGYDTQYEFLKRRRFESVKVFGMNGFELKLYKAATTIQRISGLG